MVDTFTERHRRIKKYARSGTRTPEDPDEKRKLERVCQFNSICCVLLSRICGASLRTACASSPPRDGSVHPHLDFSIDPISNQWEFTSFTIILMRCAHMHLKRCSPLFSSLRHCRVSARIIWLNNQITALPYYTFWNLHTHTHVRAHRTPHTLSACHSRHAEKENERKKNEKLHSSLRIRFSLLETKLIIIAHYVRCMRNDCYTTGIATKRFRIIERRRTFTLLFMIFLFSFSSFVLYPVLISSRR